MLRVETYQNPMLFYNNIDMNLDELHITSIPTLAMHMKKKVNYTNNWNIWIYHHFYSALHPRWTHAATILEQRRLVRELIKQNQGVWGKHTPTLIKQVEFITDSFRTFMELGFKKLSGNGKESILEQYYMKLYDYYLDLPQAKLYWEELERQLTPELLDILLDKYNQVYQKKDRKGYPLVKKIYFYSMDRMEPGRIALFQRLSKAGYEVIFRIPYEETNPILHECWKKVYDEFVPFENWTCIQEETSVVASPLKAFLEGKQGSHLPKRKIFYHEVTEPTLFKAYLKKNPMDRDAQEYIACQDALLNEYFRDEIEKGREIGHFFETPLGRFIEELYKLKLQDGQIRMSYNTFINMMTAGIVVIYGSNDALISGSRSLSLLNELKPYMEGIKSLEEILERLERYKSLHVLSKAFDDEGQSKADKSRVKRYLQNPFRAFGFMQVSEHSVTLNQFIELSHKLKLVIEKLLIEYSPMEHMAKHIEYLKKLIIESKILEGVRDTEANEYKGLLDAYQKFFGLLNARLTSTKIYDLEDMNDYIALQTKMKKEDEAEGNVILIKGLEHILGMCVNGVKQLYLCDLSTINMKKYINARMESQLIFELDQLLSFAKNTETVQQDIDLEKIIKIIKIISVQTQNFIKYSLAALVTYYEGDLHIGWIKNMNAYDAKWYLLNIIESLSEVHHVESTIDLALEAIEDDREDQNLDTSMPAKLESLSEKLSPLTWEELEICDKRFYYSNLLQHYPIYREDFTQRQLFAHLCKMMESNIGGKEQVERFIKPLFPQWNETLKKNMIETQMYKSIKQYESHDNVEFPKDMIGVQLLSRYSQNLKYLSQEERQEKLKKWFERNIDKPHVKAGVHCDRCPHQLICQEGELGIEREH